MIKKLLTACAALFLTTTATAQSLYDYSFEGIEGGNIAMESFKGKVVMVVNTASHCGFTPQYAGLEQLYQKFKDDDFVIVGIPAGDFGGQEFGTNAEVKKFIDEKYGVTFPMAGITPVKGDDAHPFYKWAAEDAGFFGSPKWNFHKYVFDKKGQFVGSFSSITKPLSTKVQTSIEQLLAE